MISATVLVKNSQKTLKSTLEALKKFPEVILLDSGSTDDSLKIASFYPNIKIYSSSFLGFGPMHNFASKLATHDWILSIDSDEVLSQELIEELFSLKLDPNTVYSLPRHNYFNNKRIKYCGGWHPDFVVRLYHRASTQFSNDLVHEKVIVKDKKVKKLKGVLLHTPYLEIADFLHKMQHYTSLFAKQHPGEEGSVTQALFHSAYAFIKSYIFKRGFLAGKEGFIISMYNSHTAFYKYLKLAERK